MRKPLLAILQRDSAQLGTGAAAAATATAEMPPTSAAATASATIALPARLPLAAFLGVRGAFGAAGTFHMK